MIEILVTHCSNTRGHYLVKQKRALQSDRLDSSTYQQIEKLIPLHLAVLEQIHLCCFSLQMKWVLFLHLLRTLLCNYRDIDLSGTTYLAAKIATLFARTWI